MYDAIVIGARCAGSPTAMLLARRGYRVLVVDRATFPSDTMSTHYIHQPGVACLQRWGLLDRLKATGCPPIERFTYLLLHPTMGEIDLTGSSPPYQGIRHAYAPRRTVLDKLLADAAVEAGAELREGFAVEEVLVEGDRVIGIRGRQKGGAAVTEKARIVIGAEGLRSLVAETVRAPKYWQRPLSTCFYYSFWSDVPVQGFEFHHLEGIAIVITPTNDGLTNINIALRPEEFPSIKRDVEGYFLKTVEKSPKAARYVREGNRVDRFVGSGGFSQYFRKPYGPGWALVGDAGYLRDPATGQGITDAFRDAELLADVIDRGFSGGLPLQRALAQYERRRNEIARPIYRMVCLYATLALPPRPILHFMAALQGNQTETDRLIGTIAGTVPHRRFFSPLHVGRVLIGHFLKRSHHSVSKPA